MPHPSQNNWEAMAMALRNAGMEDEQAVNQAVMDAQSFGTPQEQIQPSALAQVASDPYHIAELEKLAQQEARAQEQSLKPIEQQISVLKTGGGDSMGDIKPLLALSDMWGGTNLLNQYQTSSMSPEQRASKIAQLETQLAKRRGEMTRAKLEAARTKVYGAQRSERMLMKKETELSKELNNDVMKPLRDRSMQFATMEHAFNDGNYQKVLGTLALYARGVSGEKGVLTDRDINRVMPGKTLATLKADIQNWFRYASPGATLPQEFMMPLREMMAVARMNAAKEYRRYADLRERQYKARTSFKDVFQAGSGQQMFDIAKESIENFKPSQEDVQLYNKVEARWKAKRRAKEGTLLQQGTRSKQMNSAQAWLKANPKHPKADAIRRRIQSLGGL